MDEIQKGDLVYYTQIFKPPLGEYNVIELRVHSVNAEKQYFTGCETNDSKHTFLFTFSDLDKCVFINKDTAQVIVNEAEEKYGKVKKSKEKFVEEE